MNKERWHDIERVFESAVDLDGDERAQFLEQTCGADEELRREVESLLSAGTGCAEAVQQAVRTQAEEVAMEHTLAVVGQKIGPYRITDLIGRGGMGAVYRAIRDDDFNKKVAIKLIHHGMASDVIVSRFRRERQILALLEHPYIARLYDGGATRDGRPYFVMEYVEGRPITNYCEQNRLGIRERVGLFMRVCEAVEHAHSHLVVHRDIKPGNILVAEDGTPKLLDFGLAKLLDPEIEEAQTCSFIRMLTPHYASPEQIRGEPASTATDVYSLGAVLYQLLTGARPHATSGNSITAIEQAICQREPERPARISRALAGDLENIVLMALRIEPARRYRSVAQFSEDLRRYLSGLPVMARQDSLWYRTGKFVRRNAAFVAAATAVAASLIIGTTVATVQAHRAQRRFEHVRRLADVMLFDLDDKVRLLPGSIESRELMVKTGLEYLDGLAQEAGMTVDLTSELARGYERIGAVQSSPDPAERSLGRQTDAVISYRRALALAKAVERQRPNDAETKLLLAKIHLGIGWNTRDPGESERSYDEVLALVDRLKRIFPQRRREAREAPVVDNLGWLVKFRRAGALSSRAEYRAAIAMAAQSGPHLGPHVIVPSLYAIGDLDGALKAAYEYTEGRETVLSRNADDTLTHINRWSYARATVWVAKILADPFAPNLDQPEVAKAILTKGMDAVKLAILRDPEDALPRTMERLCELSLADTLSPSDPARAAALYAKILDAPKLESHERAIAWKITYPLLKLGRNVEALKRARHAAQMLQSPRANLALADALAASEDSGADEQYRQAIQSAERRSAQRPEDMHARQDLAESYEHHGAFLSALGDCGGARKRFSAAVNVWKEWPKYGVSSPYNVRRERQAAALLGSCAADARRKSSE